MTKYIILDNEENRLYKNDTINSILEGEKVGEYIKTDQGNFLIYNTKEVKESNNKTNKTKIIESIKVYNNRGDKDIKEVLRFKRLLKKRSVKDIESIEYAYNELINLYYYSNINIINWEVNYILKDTIKLILDSNVKLENSYQLQQIKSWISMGIN